MAVENIYYLDSTNLDVVKTNSDNSNATVIENVSNLSGLELLTNLQLSSTHMFLFGDASIVLTRAITDSPGVWTELLNKTSQAALLPVGRVLATLSEETSKIRSSIVTADGNIYIAYQISYDDTNKIPHTTYVLHYNGLTWSVLLTLPAERFFGWADLDHSGSFVGLKTSITMDFNNLYHYRQTGNNTQVHENCNVLRMIQGSSVTELPAPTHVTRPIVTEDLISRLGTGGLISNGQGSPIVLPSGEIVGATYDLFYRISADHSSIVPHAADFSYEPAGCQSIIIGNYFVLYYASGTATRKYVTYNMVTNTIAFTGIWSRFNNWSVSVQLAALGDGTALVFTSGNGNNATFLFNPATNSLTSLAVDFVHTGFFNNFCTLANGDLVLGVGLWATTNLTSLVHYSKSSNTWIMHDILPASGIGGLIKLINAPGDPWDGFILGTCEGYSYYICNPNTFAIVKSAPVADVAGMAITPKGVISLPYFIGQESQGGNIVKINLVDNTNSYVALDNSYYDIYNSSVTLNLTYKNANTLGITQYAMTDSVAGAPEVSLIDYTVYLNLTELSPTSANIQAVTAVSTHEVYCATVKPWMGTGYDSGSPSCIIYKWDGHAWTTFYEIPGFNFSALTNWGEGTSYLDMPYTPLLMAHKFVDSKIELVMMRDTAASVYRLYDGVLETAILQEVSGSDNTYTGERAPSVPFVNNTNLCASVSTYASLPDRNEVQVYADARLIHKPSLSLYCLTKKTEIYFSTSIPVVYSNLPAKSASSFYLNLPVITDAGIPLEAQTSLVNPKLLVTLDSVSSTEIRAKVEVAYNATNADAELSFTITAAPSGAYDSTCSGSNTYTFLVPVTPAAKHLPYNNSWPGYHTLIANGSTFYCVSETAIAASTDGGRTWRLCDTVTQPNIANTVDSIFSMCVNAPAGEVIATASSGIQRHNSYWERLPLLEYVPPIPSGTLPYTSVPFSTATPIVSGTPLTSNLEVTDPAYIGYTGTCEVFSFSLTEKSNLSISVASAFDTYLEVYYLTGTPSNYSEFWLTDAFTDGNNTVNNPSISVTNVQPMTYYIVVSGGTTGLETGSYTLSLTRTPASVAIYPKVRQLVYTGTKYIALLGEGNNDYSQYIGTSTDLTNWSYILDGASNPVMGSGYYFNCSTLATSGGTTLACMGTSCYRIASDGSFTSLTSITDTGVSGADPEFVTDGAGNWLHINSGTIFYSVDDGLTWTENNFFTLFGYYAKSLAYIAYTNSKWFVMAYNVTEGMNVDIIRASNVSFTAGRSVSPNATTFPLTWAPAGFSGTRNFVPINNTLAILYGDYVKISLNDGINWA